MVNGANFQDLRHQQMTPAGATDLDGWYDADDAYGYDTGADYMDP